MKLKRVLVKIFLTATAVSLVGCGDDFPAVEPKVVNLGKGRVSPHVLVDQEKIRFAAKRDEAGKLVYLPVSVIDGGCSFTAKECADMMSWARRNKERCE